MKGFTIKNSHEEFCYLQDNDSYMSLAILFINYLEDNFYEQEEIIIPSDMLKNVQKRMEIWLDTTLDFRIVAFKSPTTEKYNYKDDEIIVYPKSVKLESTLAFVLDFHDFVNRCINEKEILVIKKSSGWKPIQD
ncbi:MAG: hypothetical protein MUC49_20875 [Raineya sp.]|jgi:hypothetical protein|nr:hypothetical protein [Raineya sp.]